MKAGIIGLPSCGKTTVFNAISGATAKTSAFGGGGQESPNIAVVSVPDERLDWLTQLYKPQKTIAATVELVDVAGLKPGEAKEKGFTQDFLSSLRQVEALVHVVRDFSDDNLPHPSGAIDAGRDAKQLEEELIIADLIVVDKRLSKLKEDLQKKRGPERVVLEQEQELLTRFSQCLNTEKPLRQEKISEDEFKLIRGFTFLSGKPMLIINNIDESAIANNKSETGNLAAINFAKVISFCGKAEMDIAQMPTSEQAEFLQMLGIAEPARAKLVKAIYDLLDLIVFFTVGEDEVKAWTIERSTNAQNAARKIHSDIARGFIRAEVASYAALKEHGSWNSAKEKGLVRLEGKDYIVQDGDCINFRFAV